jgi:hypothetical protein
MPITVQSPYGDDETRFKEITVMVEEFIELNWDPVKTTVPVTDVAFGVFGTQILQDGRPITLRAYTFFEDARRMDVSGRRWRYQENVIVDIYVLNNEINSGRDPRAIAIKKWLEELLITWQGKMVKGIYELTFRGTRLDNDVRASNITRVKAEVEVVYIIDIVEE